MIIWTGTARELEAAAATADPTAGTSLAERGYMAILSRPGAIDEA